MGIIVLQCWNEMLVCKVLEKIFLLLVVPFSLFIFRCFWNPASVTIIV